MWRKRRPTPVPFPPPDNPARDYREFLEIRDHVTGWLLNPIEIGDAEARYAAEIDGRAIPFGLINGQWRRLLAEIQPGDELWEFRKRPPEFLAAREGLVVLRRGEPVAAIVTVES